MSAAPDSADYVAKSAPAGRVRVMNAAFWAMMVLAALCLVAAAIVVVGGPRRFARHVVFSPPMAIAPSSPETLPGPPIPAQLSVAPSSPSPGDPTGLQGRVSALEARQDRVLDAAGEALATAALTQAANQPRPFALTLSRYDRVLAQPQAAALAPLAAQGAPTRAELARQLDEVAARLAVDSRAPGRGASLPARIAYALSRLVSIRRLDPTGTGPEALIAQAQIAAGAGDIETALALTSRLPPTTNAALAPWREGARRRVAIDQAISALGAQAMADLAAARVSQP